MRPLLIVPTGVGNLASLRAAFTRLGVETRLADDAAALRSAAQVVLPGVGAFGAGARSLFERGLAAALRERIDAGAPTLAICLGLQLLGTGSDEDAVMSGGTGPVPGLGVVACRAERIAAHVRVPHMGWNFVRAGAGCRLLGDGPAYFAHGFAWSRPPAGFGVARVEHGGTLVAGIERGAVLACQFHPELSGDYGAGLLARWLAAGGAPC